jgi:hypothetical protein
LCSDVSLSSLSSLRMPCILSSVPHWGPPQTQGRSDRRRGIPARSCHGPRRHGEHPESPFHLPRQDRRGRNSDLIKSPFLWNLALISAGSALCVLAVNGVLVPKQFLSGGFTGRSLLIHYLFPLLALGDTYFVLNMPLYALGWRCMCVDRSSFTVWPGWPFFRQPYKSSGTPFPFTCVALAWHIALSSG